MDLLAEYEFKIQYRPGLCNQAAGFLSRFRLSESADYKIDEGDLALVVGEQEQDLQPYLREVGKYLIDATASGISREIRIIVKRMSRQFLLWDGQMCRRMALRPKLVSPN